MNKKLILALVLITVIVLCSSSVFAANPKAVPIPAEERMASTPSVTVGAGASCRLQNDVGTYYYIWGNAVGDGYANYFDPVVCGIPTYPFVIDTVEFVLTNYTPSGGNPPTWPLDVRVTICGPTNDTCFGPQTPICSEVFTIQQTEAGTIKKALSQTCCVNGPFYATLTLESGTDFQPNTSQNFPNHADSCRAWAYWNGVWYNWAVVARAFGAWVGYPCIRVIGRTEHPDCIPPWQNNYKMHFPQLPDLIGWDVNATMPKVLADDWQCSQTGWVTDIHFWGSWKDLDGDPSTDDYYTPMPYFILSIHENIPASPDTPWSRPGRQVWGWGGEIPGIPSEPPTLEGWYDPNTTTWNCIDHVPYWRYDFYVNQAYPAVDSFFQYKDSIYWLNISAMNIPEPYQWGWKNSRDHFMDDAVYRDFNVPTMLWTRLYEPPRGNRFTVYFDSLGLPHDNESTNYYGWGWYQYEYWANMWFYDNPFTYTRPKHAWLNFNIDSVGPLPSAQFAINWSTPAWDSLEMGRPPLPGEDEMLYIGRQVFPVVFGPNTIDFTLPYNPEWVSVDFVAQNVSIYGMIYHQCIGTSLDLAFVITGHELPVKCGDVNNDGILGLGDVVYLITYQYKGGPPPVPCKCVGDVNNDDVVGLGDVVYLISYQYKGGPAPNPNCCNPPWGCK